MHKDKIREMTRGILPSKARKAARHEKARIARAHRHQVRQALRDVGLNISPEDEDIILDDSELMLRINDSEVQRRRDLYRAVQDRRAADKLSPFLRWCKARTKHIPEDKPEERYYTISGLIGGPSDLIREHALGHFLDPEYDFNPYSFKARYRTSGPDVIIPRHVFYRALKAAFETKHKLLNRLCKEHTYRQCKTDDSCIEVIRKKRWVYRFQPNRNYYVWKHEETTYCPREGDYRPGTLARVLSEYEQEVHSVSQCENRVILRGEDDIDRLMHHIFGGRDEWTAYTKYAWIHRHHKLVAELCKFFVRYDLMYDYLGAGK